MWSGMPLRDRSPAAVRRRRRRHFSVWTFVAPAVLIVAVVVVVNVVTHALDARERASQAKARTAAAAVARPGTTAAKKAVKPRYHRVKSGESFSSIADRFKTTVDALTVLNPNVDPLKLTPGARIRVQ
jgi:LysM repeat protein